MSDIKSLIELAVKQQQDLKNCAESLSESAAISQKLLDENKTLLEYIELLEKLLSMVMRIGIELKFNGESDIEVIKNTTADSSFSDIADAMGLPYTKRSVQCVFDKWKEKKGMTAEELKQLFSELNTAFFKIVT